MRARWSSSSPTHLLMELENTAMVRDFLSVWLSPNLLPLGFDNGSPDGNDPLQLARQMASRGITLVGLFFKRYPFFSSFSSSSWLANLHWADIRYGTPQFYIFVSNNTPFSMPLTFTKQSQPSPLVLCSHFWQQTYWLTQSLEVC